VSAKSIKVNVDAGKWLGELAHNWNYIGYDELNYTYIPESKNLGSGKVLTDAPPR
jgi:xylan 1,4-beta-xylosidase